MQLATSVDGQPWACTVHYYSDENLNLYWVSRSDRKHSQDIKQNNKVAVAVMVHENTPDEDYVIGMSIEGAAEIIEQDAPEEIVQGYVSKHGKDPDMTDIANGRSPHKFYVLKPLKIVLFDNKNFPENPRKEWLLDA